MPARELSRHAVERVWGRQRLPAPFDDESRAAPVGEAWFSDAGRDDAELLVKYLFTSERLSVQVHPDDTEARARGHKRGKDEAWLVLAAEPGAVIGLGLTRQVPPEALRAAALDGSVEHLLDWKPVRAGDFFYSPAGAIHAIGAGLSLIEIQQNLDLTYRLYDYGRPRELHLDDAVAVATPAPYRPPFAPADHGPGRRILAAGLAFVVERWTFDRPMRVRSDDGQLQLIPVASGGAIDGAALTVGTVWRVEGKVAIDPGAGLDLLAAYPGAKVRDDLCVAI